MATAFASDRPALKLHAPVPVPVYQQPSTPQPTSSTSSGIDVRIPRANVNTCPLVFRGLFLHAVDAIHPLNASLFTSSNSNDKTDPPPSSPTQITVLRANDNIHFLDNDGFATRENVSIDALLSALDTPSIHNGPDNQPSQAQHQERLYHRAPVPRALDAALLSSPLIASVSSSSAPTTLTALARIWASSAGSITPLHYDKCHGLLVQLHGQKRFLIVPRDDARNCYLHNGITGPTHASRVRGADQAFMRAGSGADDDDDDDDDETRDLLSSFPLLAAVRPWIVTLEPGDCVYTPPGFLHEVTSVSGSVSVTIPYDMTEAELDDRPAFMKF
ncbi:hypothetical protein HDU86_003576 [Geranomyces michiganensis]|nr:hypothetical protein HDU86_003576 [Geranomyces michiganensis]